MFLKGETQSDQASGVAVEGAGEGGAAAVFAGFADAALGFTADIEGTGVAEGSEEAVEKDLRLSFFVAGDVGLGPGDEGGELGSAGIRHNADGAEVGDAWQAT